MEGEKPKVERPVFEGFNPTFKGFSQLPNEWLDEITSQIDNVAELKIVLFVYRHTWGFQEKTDPDKPAKHDEIKKLTTDEFMHGRKKSDGTRMDRGTGLSNRSVIDGIRNAVKHGYILETVDDKDKGRVVKSYALNIIKSDKNSCEESSQDPMKNPHRHMKPSHSNYEDSSHRSEKRTSARHQKNEREKERQSPTIAEENRTSDNAVHASHSFIHSSSFSLSQDCLNKVKEFAEMYRDENVSQHQQEADEIFRASGISDDQFYNALIQARGVLRGKNRTMEALFSQLRGMLKVTK